jgi:hypothetical protein
MANPTPLNPSFRSLVGKAERALQKSDYGAAIVLFRQALAEKKNVESAIGGLLIADFCAKRSEFAPQIAEFYSFARAVNPRKAKTFVLRLIEAIENEESEKNVAAERFLTARDGIEYADFLSLLESAPNFADLFEKITRSTNVYVSRSDDWFDFVDRLVENDYYEIAYRFIESAAPLVGMDARTRVLLDKLSEKEARKKISRRRK